MYEYFIQVKFYNRQYLADIQFLNIFDFFAFQAVFIACLGLFGLAAFQVQKRSKEIGTCKVMGASATHIIILLSGDFTKLIIIAFGMAIPVAYYLMQRWHEGYAYRTDISPWVFLLAGLGALLIAWLTVSWQSIKAALANPVDSLRNE